MLRPRRPNAEFSAKLKILDALDEESHPKSREGFFADSRCPPNIQMY